MQAEAMWTLWSSRLWWMAGSQQVTVYSLPLPGDTHTLPHSDTHTQAVKCGQAWAESVKRWPSMEETQSHEQGRPGQWSRRHRKPRDYRLEMLQGGVMRMVRGEMSAWIQMGRPERSEWTHWTSSHTPCGSLTHSITHFMLCSLHLPTLHPTRKDCEWEKTWTKWRRKTCWDQTEESDPWGFGGLQGELSSAKHHRAAGKASKARRQAVRQSGGHLKHAGKRIRWCTAATKPLNFQKNYRVKLSLPFLALSAYTSGAYA